MKRLKIILGFFLMVSLLTACTFGEHGNLISKAEHDPNADSLITGGVTTGGSGSSGTQNSDEGNTSESGSLGTQSSDEGDISGSSPSGTQNSDGGDTSGSSPSGTQNSDGGDTNGSSSSKSDGALGEGTGSEENSIDEKDRETYVVVLDPGHGGRFSGAVYNGKEEKRLNLKIAEYCKAYLEKEYQNFTVYLTREEDKPLSDNQVEDLTLRVEMAKELGADVLVSLHLNASSDHKKKGAEVYCPHRENVKSSSFTLAECILAELEELGLQNNGSMTRNSNDTYDADGNPVEYYAINRHSADRDIIGIIVEHGYMDSKTDAVFFEDEEALRELGEADARGIAAYLNKIDRRSANESQ